MRKIDPRMTSYLAEFGVGVSLPAAPLAPAVTAEDLRRLGEEQRRIAAEMWTRDAQGSETVRFNGRVIRKNGTTADGQVRIENRPWREGEDTRYLVCAWSDVVVNKECREENVSRFILDKDRFEWAQANVKRLLSEKASLPRITRYNAPRWAAWIRDVYKYVALAYWSLNVRAYAPIVPAEQTTWTGAIPTKATWLAWDGPKVTSLRDRIAVAFRNASGLSAAPESYIGWVPRGAAMPMLQAMADLGAVQEGRSLLPGEATPRRSPLFNTWSETGATNRIPFVPSSEADFLSDFGGTVDAAYRTVGPTSLYIRHPSKQVSASGLYGPQTSEVFNTVGAGFDRFARWMSETSTFSAGDRPTVVHTGFYDERGNFVWRPVLAAEGQIEWATAIAEDLAIGSYEGILLESLERWRVTSEMFPSYVRQGYKGLSDVVRSAIEQNRALARQRADTAESSGQAVIAVAGSTNIVGLIVTALYMLIDGYLGSPHGEIATGASSIPWCPPLPFLRTMTQAGCDVGALLERLMVKQAALAPGGVRPSAETFISPAAPSTDTSDSTTLRISSGGGGGGGSGALLFGAGAAVLYFLMRRS
jgi:hypothetical protein